MKRRLTALFCVLASVAVLLIPWSYAAGTYDDVYLVAVNDTVLLGLISESQMPVRRGNMIYAPYTVLDNQALGLSYALNRGGGTFTIFNREKTLIFRLSGAGSVDKKGVEYSQGIISRNGVVYIPLRFVCSFFGLTYSFYNLTLPDGTVPIARLCTSNVALSDAQFGVQAAQLVAGPLAQYMAAQATPTPTPTPAPPLTSPLPSAPSVPTPSPSPSPEPQGADVSFAIECTDPDGFFDVLNTLNQYQVKALFLFPVETLAAQDTQVRSAAAVGHQIGLLLTDEDPEAQLRRGNELLRHILRCEATQVSLQGAAAAAEVTDPDDGPSPWWVWPENVRLGTGNAASQVRNLIQDVTDQGVAYVTLTSSSRSAQVLQQVLPTFGQQPFGIWLMTEAS